MTLHAIREYIKYRLKAQNRHGVHSPFAYAIVEDIIENRKGLTFAPTLDQTPPIDERYAALISRIASYHHYHTLWACNGNPPTGKYDILVFNAQDPATWSHTLKTHAPCLKNESMVVVADIHTSAVHTQAWGALCAHPQTRMSIDLYGIGLLFFRQEFKERQHFVLAY